MLEGDYVWMKPLKIPMANSLAKSWLFPYEYIVPTAPGLKPIMRKMYPEESGPVSDIPNSGPSPVLMRIADWKKVSTMLVSIHGQGFSILWTDAGHAICTCTMYPLNFRVTKLMDLRACLQAFLSACFAMAEMGECCSDCVTLPKMNSNGIDNFCIPNEA